LVTAGADGLYSGDRERVGGADEFGVNRDTFHMKKLIIAFY